MTHRYRGTVTQAHIALPLSRHRHTDTQTQTCIETQSRKCQITRVQNLAKRTINTELSTSGNVSSRRPLLLLKFTFVSNF